MLKARARVVWTFGCLLALITAPAAFADSIVYSANGGDNTVYTYDQGTKVPTQFENSSTGVSGPTAIVYDSIDRLIFLADGPSNTIFRYDAASGATVSHFTPSSPVSSVTAMAYDPVDNRVLLADGPTRTVYQYDPGGTATGTQFNAPPSGAPTAVAYDSIDRRVFVGYDNGEIFRYDSGGPGTQVANTPNLGRVTAMTYDSGDDRLLVAYDDLTRQTIYRYDSLGNVVQIETLFNDSTADQLGRVTAMTYDAVDNVILAGYATNSIYQYDTNGTRTFFSSTDVNGLTALADGPVPEPSTLALLLLGAMVVPVLPRAIARRSQRAVVATPLRSS